MLNFLKALVDKSDIVCVFECECVGEILFVVNEGYVFDLSNVLFMFGYCV